MQHQSRCHSGRGVIYCSGWDLNARVGGAHACSKSTKPSKTDLLFTMLRLSDLAVRVISLRSVISYFSMQYG